MVHVYMVLSLICVSMHCGLTEIQQDRFKVIYSDLQKIENYSIVTI